MPEWKRSPLSGGEEGFTLLEVLASLVITVILVFVMSSSLATVMRGEESAEWLRQGTLLVRTLSAQSCRTGGAFMDVSGQWNIRSEDVRVRHDDEEERWRVWELTPQSRSGLVIPVALRLTTP